MKAIPPLVDSLGNINLHMREDFVMAVKPGVGFATLNGRVMQFMVPSRGVVSQLVAHPDNADWLLINMAASTLQKVKTGDEFVLIDRTGGTSTVRWEGLFKRRGN